MQHNTESLNKSCHGTSHVKTLADRAQQLRGAPKTGRKDWLKREPYAPAIAAGQQSKSIARASAIENWPRLCIEHSVPKFSAPASVALLPALAQKS